MRNIERIFADKVKQARHSFTWKNHRNGFAAATNNSPPGSEVF